MDSKQVSGYPKFDTCFHEILNKFDYTVNINMWDPISAKGVIGSESYIGNPFSAYRILHIIIYSVL